ncbi:hypothetical protein KJA15_03425 [Patescibacteria group bacterium]|nr:hypothetical protein [Patescibacteria group bacterium]
MNFKYVLSLVILILLIVGGILFLQWWMANRRTPYIPPPVAGEINGIPVYQVSEPGVQIYPTQFMDIPATYLISLEENETMWVEGAYWGKSIRWPQNSICFKEKIDVPEDSVIEAKAKIIKVKEDTCSDAEILGHEIIYEGKEIKDIAGQLSSVCPKIEDFINKEREGEPIKLTACLGFYGEKFTRFSYEWIPFRPKLVVAIHGSGVESWEKLGSICLNIFQGAIIIDPIKNKIDGIFLDEIEESCAG